MKRGGKMEGAFERDEVSIEKGLTAQRTDC